jgi:sphingolipid delta-4 desaturase
MRSDFPVTDEPNPHIIRARRILKAHPEVKELFRLYPATGAWIVAVSALQWAIGAFVADLHWGWMLLAAYTVGAMASHSLFVLIHEACHDVIVKPVWANKVFGILCNVGQALPTAMSFRKFHLLHHSNLDEYDFDADLAFRWEARVVGTSPVRKMIWLLLFPLIEIVRPLRVPRSFTDGWMVANVVAIVAADALVAWWLGPQALVYLLLSTIFGVGLHPLGARWIQEHYTFVPGQETYSYYGIGNTFAFNIGYHNEHHDLVRVPWVDLPKLKAMAPEFYDNLACHTSWTKVLMRFFFDRDIDLFTRITRDRNRRLRSEAPPEAEAA